MSLFVVEGILEAFAFLVYEPDISSRHCSALLLVVSYPEVEGSQRFVELDICASCCIGLPDDKGLSSG